MRKFLLAAVSLVSVFLGCSKINGDIDRVVDPYYDKAFFNSKWQTQELSPEEWYYRMTVVDTPANTEAVSIGDGHWLHPETIRWEITKDYLIGWRSFAAVPGSENELEPGAQNHYRGAPVVVFPIASQFDILREFDSTTLDQTNVISENTTASWNKRRFLRVDFSNNLVEQFQRSDYGAGYYGPSTVEKGTAYAVMNNDPADPKRIRMTSGYFDLTTRQGIRLDIMAAVGGYGAAFRYDSASPIVDIRHSFMKKTNSDYEPLAYPDSVVVKDTHGNDIRDASGTSVRLPIWEKFGFYRSSFSGRQSWDKHRGSLESGKNYNATRFNIWEKSKNEDGTLIPMQQRTPKPIIYYTNVEHPDSLLEASQSVAQQWNQAFKEVVFYAQPGRYSAIADVPDMYLLRQNSCNFNNVDRILSNLPGDKKQKILGTAKIDLSDVKSRLASATNLVSDSSFTDAQNQETQAKNDLERVCAALEFYTQGSPEPFVYQRPGDLRFNMYNLLTKRALTPWSGLGPMYADAITGEIIQAVANVNLWYIDRRAAQAASQVDLLNGEVNIDGLQYGEDIKLTVAKSALQAKMAARQVPSKTALRKMDRRFDTLRRGHALMPEISPQFASSQLAMMRGTKFEKKLFATDQNEANDEYLLASLLFPQFDQSQKDLSDQVLDQISPVRGNDLASRYMKKVEQSRNKLGVMDPPEYIDNLIVGIALQYKGLPKKERFQKIRVALYTAVALHEAGHNVGLAHNMAGSADALNYGERFWQLQALPEELESAASMVQNDADRNLLLDCVREKEAIEKAGDVVLASIQFTTQNCLRQSETTYSSIMDYHGPWNAFNGLGRYDKAAIKFGYAQQAEVFPTENLKVSVKDRTLKRWLFLNDWRKIPSEMVTSAQDIENRQHVQYRWGSTSTDFIPPNNEVPYRYCIDSSGMNGPDCNAFDYGPDKRAQAEWLSTQYWQHYYLTQFARDRIWSFDFDFGNLVNRDFQVMDSFNHIMKWYYYYKATDAEFTGSDAEKDYLSAVVSGLNHYAHVLGHPESGTYVTAPVHVTENLLNPTADQDRLAPANLMISWENLTQCQAANIANVANGEPESARPGYQMQQISLGDGRPLYASFTHDYEDYYLNYLGTFYSKLSAGYFLAYPGSWFPRTDQLEDPRFYAINWYRLFPDEVGKLFRDLITQNVAELGPLVDEHGELHHRDLLDPATLRAPDYTGMTPVMPAMASFMPYRSMLYAGALLSGHIDTELNINKAMKVSVKGSEDDLKTLDDIAPDQVATFVHPALGYTYRAAKVGNQPIAFEMVQKLNRLKDRYVRLETCVNDSAARTNDTFCHCVKDYESRNCCFPGNPSCPAPTLQRAGTGVCKMQTLQKRRDLAREEMEASVGFLDDMRWFVQQFDNRL